MTRPEWLTGELIDSVAFRLARADELEYELGVVASNWSRDPLALSQRRRADGRLDVVVSAIRPIPPEVSILFSETIHQLRSAVDNTVFHLVEKRHGSLTVQEALAVSMPIYDDVDKLVAWHKRAAKKIPALASDSELSQRIASLQPFNSSAAVPSVPRPLAMLMGVTPAEAHPLSLLQAYSNWDKHRAIRAAAVRSVVQNGDEPFWGSDRSMRPLAIGQTIAVATPGRPSLLEINSAVHVERPGTDVWVGVGAEISTIHHYVAETLIPTLVSGSAAPGAFPSTIDLTDSGDDSIARLSRAIDTPAHQRVVEHMERRLQSHGDAQLLPVDDIG